MKSSAGFPLLVTYLVTIHAYCNRVSFLPVDDMNLNGVVGHEELDNLLSISTLRQDDGYGELLRRSYWAQGESKQRSVQRRDLNISPSHHQPITKAKHVPTAGLLARSKYPRPIQEPIIPQDGSRLPQSIDPSSFTGISIRSAELQEDLIRIYSRNPPRDDSPGQSSRGSRGSRSISPPLSYPRAGTLRNQGQQRALTNRRRVNVLRPLTSETLAEWATQRRENQSPEEGTGTITTINSGGPLLSQRQQQQRRQTSLNQLTSSLANSPPSSPINGNRSRHRAQAPTGEAGSPQRSSSISSLGRKSDRSAAATEPANRESEVQSRSTRQGINVRPPSLSHEIPRQRRRQREEEHNQVSASITTSERSTGEPGDKEAASLSEEEPTTSRRRLQRRLSKHNDLRNNSVHAGPESHLHNRNTKLIRRGLTSSRVADSTLLRRGSKKNSKANRSGSQGQRSRTSSISASSSTSSLQTSKSAAKLSDVSQENQKDTASSSQPQGQSSQTRRGRKSRQKSQESKAAGPRPRGTAYLYGKMSGRKLNAKDPSSTQNEDPSRLSPVRLGRSETGAELSRASSATSFNSVMSKTWSDISLPNSPSGSSVKSWFSARSGTSASPPGSPRISLPGSPGTSPPGSPKASLPGPERANLAGSPGASSAGQSALKAGSINNPPISTPPESPRSAIARTKSSRAQSIPPSPFANTRPVAVQSAPSSPSAHYRPSPFANAHSRAYSAPELSFYSPSSSQIDTPSTSLSRKSSSGSYNAAGPTTQASSPSSTPPRPAVGPDSRPLSPASAISWRTQTPLSRQDSIASSHSSTLSHAVNAAALDLPPSPGPAQASSPRMENNTPPAREGRRRSFERPLRLDPVVAPPRSFRFGPVGSPIQGSPVFGAPRNSFRRD